MYRKSNALHFKKAAKHFQCHASLLDVLAFLPKKLSEIPMAVSDVQKK
jgi:hypothetical protein